MNVQAPASPAHWSGLDLVDILYRTKVEDDRTVLEGVAASATASVTGEEFTPVGTTIADAVRATSLLAARADVPANSTFAVLRDDAGTYHAAHLVDANHTQPWHPTLDPHVHTTFSQAIPQLADVHALVDSDEWVDLCSTATAGMRQPL